MPTVVTVYPNAVLVGLEFLLATAVKKRDTSQLWNWF